MRGPFLIQEIEARSGDNPHTIITFSSAGRRLRSAPVWASERHRIEHLSRGQAVLVTGVLGHWRDQPQLQVQTIQPLAPADTRWEELLPSIGDPAPWWRLIDHWRAAVRGPRLVQTLDLFFGDDEFRRRFEQCPASLTGHHARLGGLLQHTCEVARLALAAAEMVSVADPDVLVSGALLHDIGKVESYRWGGVFEFTVPGRVIGHVVLGARMLDRAVCATGACQPDELDLLLHLVLSHHGRLEFGSPVLPLLLEAELLAYADLASARGATFAETLARPDLFRSTDPFSTNPVWQLDHRHPWRGRSDWGCTPQIQERSDGPPCENCSHAP